MKDSKHKSLCFILQASAVFMVANGQFPIDGFNDTRLIHTPTECMYEYKYYYGEKLHLSCLKEDEETYLDLNELSDFIYTNDTHIYVDLSDADNGKQVNCVQMKSGGVIQNKVTLRLMEPGRLYIEGFDENRLLRRSTTEYIYKYYVGEQLELVCRPQTASTSWSIGPKNLTSYTIRDASFHANLSQLDVQKSFICGYYVPPYDYPVGRYVTLNLIDTGILSVFYFEGFDRRRFKFINATDYTYTFSADEYLNIHCLKSGNTSGHTEWKYSDTENTSFTTSNDGSRLSATLSQADRSKYVSCILIIGTLKKEKRIQLLLENQTLTTPSSQSSSPAKQDNNTYYIIGGVAGSIVIIILMIIQAVLITRCKDKGRQSPSPPPSPTNIKVKSVDKGTDKKKDVKNKSLQKSIPSKRVVSEEYDYVYVQSKQLDKSTNRKSTETVAEGSSDEEWSFETLKQYNIYNI